MLPVIPASMVDVDVVRRWRDGMPVAVAVAEDSSARGDEPSPDVVTAAGHFGVDAALLGKIGVRATAGDVCSVPTADGGFGWTIGVGAGRPREWRAAGAALARVVRERLGAGESDLDDPADLGDAPESEYIQVRLPRDADEDIVTALTLGLSLGDYRFRVSNKSTPPRMRKALLVAADDADLDRLREAVVRAREWAAGTALARDFANTPSNIKDPAWLTGTAARLANELDGMTATVRDEKWLTEHGFGGLLAVGGGSASAPRLLELSWRPENVSGPHLVLVGKGITFDTGGVSLKPADGMHLMRTDMAGGGAVISAILAIARLELPVKVTALVPAAENHVSGSSYRPGDVVRHYGGKTTEVANTDAEGRMVLADALAYAAEQFEPDLIVDVATLTGAMKVALGTRTGGVFASADDIVSRLCTAGERVGEQWWPMPLIEDHVQDVQGDTADVKQAPSGPGGVVAALFLREFTAGLPWAHLDIAGPARAEKPYEEVVAGATGFATRTLIELAADLADGDDQVASVS